MIDSSGPDTCIHQAILLSNGSTGGALSNSDARPDRADGYLSVSGGSNTEGEGSRPDKHGDGYLAVSAGEDDEKAKDSADEPELYSQATVADITRKGKVPTDDLETYAYMSSDQDGVPEYSSLDHQAGTKRRYQNVADGRPPLANSFSRFC